MPYFEARKEVQVKVKRAAIARETKRKRGIEQLGRVIDLTQRGGYSDPKGHDKA
jgi:hypothetical protein